MESYESTENALMDSFKAAALKVTTLYKDSLVQNRKAYAAGYQQALQDLYEFISVYPENGHVPVQDILSFARHKSNQLASHISTHHTTHRSEDQKTLFQIDPSTPFTFTVPPTNLRHMDDLWHQATTTSVSPNEGKRKLNPSEFNFLGRSMNLSLHEPPMKRGRSRREEPTAVQQQPFLLQQEEQQPQQPYFEQQYQHH